MQKPNPKKSDKMTKKLIVILLCLVLFFGLFYSISKIEKRVDNLSRTIESQAKEIEELHKETENWQLAISDLYEMNKSHANCVAMAVLMNSDSVLADAYDRTEEEQAKLYGNDKSFAKFYGRLYVPDAKIDVALYSGNSQGICDRPDSANIYSLGLIEEKTIVDHNNQEFSKLFSVEVGMKGYIQLENGDIINIECTDVFNSHNTGPDITDEEGNSVMGAADYLMYTCRNGWQNIRICLWEKY